MKKHHTTFVLMTLFFTGLIVYWWAGNTDIPTQGELHSVLPRLNRVEAKVVRRVEIDRPKSRVVFERRERDDWQMKEPVDAAANSAMVTTLVNNLRVLRRSSEAGTINGSDAEFGFAPPAATVRFYGDDPKQPLAELEIGGEVKGFKDQRYVRAVGAKGIDVVDSRMVSQTQLAPVDWREKNLFDMPTFYVKGVTVTGPGRDLEVARDEGRRWEISRPISAPADDEKAEGVAAELASLRVAEGEKGYVKDNVTDFAPYGLDKPVMTITLNDMRPLIAPQTLDVGGTVPDKPELRYARRKDQDDVVIIDAKGIADLGTKPNALRSQRVADVSPGRAAFLTVESGDRTFKLAQTATEWVILGPKPAKADAASIALFLTRLGQLETSEYLEPRQVSEPRLDPPIVTIKVWQVDPKGKLPAEASEAPQGEPHVNLRLGRHDAVRKVLYAQIAGDKAILTLPEAFRDALPKGALAFRDRTIQTFNPTRVSALSITRDKTVYELVAPDTPGKTLHWRMTKPVDAQADDEQATKVAMLLGNLHAAELVTDQPADEKTYGLDRPVVSTSWTLRPEEGKDKDATPTQGTLHVGAKVAGSENRYAMLAEKKLVFTLSPDVVDPFLGELHDHRVLGFVPGTVERIVFRWPGRTLDFVSHQRGPGQLPEWKPGPGVDPTGFDVSKINALLEGLSKLQTDRFVQYVGIFPESVELTPPRLAIEFHFDGPKPKTLRLGSQSADGPLYATTETGSAGAVFTLAGPAWVELAKAPRRPTDLPEEPIQPAKKAEKP